MTREQVIQYALAASRAEDYSPDAYELAVKVLAAARTPPTVDIPVAWAHWLAEYLRVALEIRRA